jgi:hypothetical protein
MLLINVDKENNKIYHILQLKDERIVSSLKNKRIKIIKLITPSNYIIEMELIGHEKEVLKTIEIFNEDLISYSDDLSIIIWKKVKEKYIKYKKFIAHEKYIYSGIDSIIEISKNKIISYSAV